MEKMNTQHYKFRICKFFLNNKCKNGFKCSFEHLKLHEIELLIKKLKGDQLQNVDLKKETNDISLKDKNTNDKVAISVSSNVHAPKKPLFSSLFASENDRRTKNTLKNSIYRIYK